MATDPRVVEELRRISAERKALEEAGSIPNHYYNTSRNGHNTVQVNIGFPLPVLDECPHLGGVLECCHKCASGLKDVRECDLHDRCTRIYVSGAVRSCDRCDDHPTRVPPGGKPEEKVSVTQPADALVTKMPPHRRLNWQYGVTTVPSRRDDLLPRTLASLKKAGFDSPTLFVDGEKDPESWRGDFGLEVVARWPLIRTFGNWTLSLAELYIRDPGADRYAIFQDDFVMCLGVREYLERSEYPKRGYQNLYTFNSNTIPMLRAQGATTLPLDYQGWHPSNQFGRGAVALVFDNEAVITLLTHQHMVERPKDVMKGWKAVDGGIVTALKKAGWTEYVHTPSLVQHTGTYSSMRNKPHKPSPVFRGENFDARTLLRTAPVC